MAQTQNRNQLALQPWTAVVAELMGYDRAVKPLVEFLQATEIGSREGSNERSKEWENRVDGEGEEDLWPNLNQNDKGSESSRWQNAWRARRNDGGWKEQGLNRIEKREEKDTGGPERDVHVCRSLP